MSGVIGKLFLESGLGTAQKAVFALSKYFIKSKQIKMFKNAFNETHFAEELSRATSEKELVTMVNDFVRNHQEIFKSNPHAYNEFSEIIRQRISYIRNNNTVCCA